MYDFLIKNEFESIEFYVKRYIFQKGLKKLCFTSCR